MTLLYNFFSGDQKVFIHSEKLSLQKYLKTLLRSYSCLYKLLLINCSEKKEGKKRKKNEIMNSC